MLLLALLTAFSLVSYLARTNISVAAKLMMPDLGLTEIELGQIFSAFMLGYALFQIPAGMAGDRRGPRLVLAVAGLSWAVCSLLTAVAPGFLSLLAVRFLLGVGEAATYPVAMRAVASWIPVERHALSNSIIVSGLAIGSTFSPALFSWLMVAFGWRSVFLATAVICAALAIAWARYAPRHAAAVHAAPVTHKLLKNRNLGLLCAAYFLDSYVLFIYIFWLYLYLVDVRGFSVLRGGVFTGLPYLLAIFLVPAAGALSDRLSRRLGRLAGRRTVALCGLFPSGLLMFAGAEAANPYLAMACLSFSAALLMSTEGPFWSTSIDIGQTQAGAAGGIMNMAGNLGGVVSTALVPVLVKYSGWTVSLASAAVLAVVAGIIWLLIRPEGESRL